MPLFWAQIHREAGGFTTLIMAGRVSTNIVAELEYHVIQHPTDLRRCGVTATYQHRKRLLFRRHSFEELLMHCHLWSHSFKAYILLEKEQHCYFWMAWCGGSFPIAAFHIEIWWTLVWHRELQIREVSRDWSGNSMILVTYTLEPCKLPARKQIFFFQIISQEIREQPRKTLQNAYNFYLK